MMDKFLFIFILSTMTFAFAEDDLKILESKIDETNLYQVLEMIDFRDVNGGYIYQKEYAKEIQKKALYIALQFWETKEKFLIDRTITRGVEAYQKIKLLEWYFSLPCTSIKCLFFRLNIAFNHTTILYIPSKLKPSDFSHLQDYLKSERIFSKVITTAIINKLTPTDMILKRVHYPILSSTLSTYEKHIAQKLLSHINESSSLDKDAKSEEYQFQIYCDLLQRMPGSE